MKDKNWEILDVSRARVDQFRRTVPLITDLKNPAMRQRHWDQVQVDYSSVFTVRLHVMQCTVLPSQFCLSVRPFVCLPDACIVTKRNNRLSVSQHRTKQSYL